MMKNRKSGSLFQKIQVAKSKTLFMLSLRVLDASLENRLRHLDLFGDGPRGKRSKPFLLMCFHQDWASSITFQ